MIIGVPKEIKANENRVSLVPGGAEALVHAGHTVLVARGAGVGTGGETAPVRAPAPAGRRPPPARAQRANCAGSTPRSTGRWCDVGRRYWPIVTMSTPIPARSARQPTTSSSVSPMPTISPDFVVSPADSNPDFRQSAGRAGFLIRAALAATLSGLWGVYSGFELCEHVAVKPGSEEYLDTEKFQLRPRDWAAAEAEGRTLAPYLTRLNQIRRAHPALQRLRNLRFHHADNDQIICYSKTEHVGDGEDTLIVVVNLDPFDPCWWTS